MRVRKTFGRFLEALLKDFGFFFAEIYSVIFDKPNLTHQLPFFLTNLLISTFSV
jgi:hypothetical protein